MTCVAGASKRGFETPQSTYQGLGMLGIFNRGREKGANLVEFALLAPLLIILLLGIIEFGWLFSQNNDVKHGAREGARAAAVNFGDNTALHNHTCDAMDLTSSNITVQFTDSGNEEVGSIASVSVVATPSSLSGLGLIEVFLPGTLTSTIEFRLEQPSDSWNSDGSPQAC